MIRYLYMIGLLVSVVSIDVPGVFAADKLLDVAIYVTGNFDNPTWSPGTGAGPGEGITWNTTKTNMSFCYTPGTYTFQVDTLTGRVGVGTTPPKRPSLTAPVKIENWSLLE